MYLEPTEWADVSRPSQRTWAPAEQCRSKHSPYPCSEPNISVQSKAPIRSTAYWSVTLKMRPQLFMWRVRCLILTKIGSCLRNFGTTSYKKPSWYMRTGVSVRYEFHVKREEHGRKFAQEVLVWCYKHNEICSVVLSVRIWELAPPLGVHVFVICTGTHVVM
jgi:hypothetical protein